MEFNSGTKQILLFVQEEWKLLIFLTIIFAMYFYYTSTFDFFEKKGIVYMKPTIIMGNLGPRLMAKKSFHQFQLDVYNYFKGKPYGGIFEGRKPVLYVLDPDIIKAITIRDFEHFVDRNTLNSNEPKYLSQSLINLKLQSVDSKLSTRKIIHAISQVVLEENLSYDEPPFICTCFIFLLIDNTEVEMKDTMGHLTLEVIGACAFGIRCDALSGENSHFIKVAEKFNYMPKMKRMFIFFLLMCMPFMFKFLNISFLHHDTTEELVRMLQAAKSERRSSGIKKTDFLQLLIDAAESEKTDSAATKTKTYLDDDTMDAQSLLFLIAGYETSSTLLSFAIHMLATKPDLQEKLRVHVEDMTKGKDISYEVLSQLNYLEGFLLETLRLYPPVSRVDRVCTKGYTVPGTSLHVDVGDILAIPVYGVHMDPDNYPEPQEFKPERFMHDEKRDRPSHLFLAFGAGPRNCIGLRFAMYSAKLAMVSLLKNFKFSACDKTEDPIKFDTSAVLLKAGSGLWVRIEAL